MHRHRRIIPARVLPALACSTLMVLALPGPALAALGQDASTIDSDSSGLRAQHATQRSASGSAGSTYAVHQLLLPGGTQVREFVSAGGRVFAVTWSGPSIPDLSVLLGEHFPRYLKAAERRSAASRGPVKLNDPDLVLRNEGHPRAFHGMAYLPADLPSAFDLSQLR
jgi:hypothetical protein